MSADDNKAMQALSEAGAFCGQCGDEPGDRTCPDCESCYQEYVAALRAAGWAPRAEVEREVRAEVQAEDSAAVANLMAAVQGVVTPAQTEVLRQALNVIGSGGTGVEAEAGIRRQLHGELYESVTAFQSVAHLSSLQHAQMRGYLAEHLTEALLSKLVELDRLRTELAATRRAKAENDERFQLAAAEQRERAEKAEAELKRVRAEVLREAAEELGGRVPPVTAGPLTHRDRGLLYAAHELRRMADAAGSQS